MSLARYQKKRDFAKTREPEGRVRTSSKRFIFVVHKHYASHLHYDLRLEMEGVLKSWAVPKGPSMNPREKRLAVHVEDHPYEYRTFEGTIPEGQYGAGKVEIWDRGSYKLIAGSIRAGELVFELRGKRLQGQFALVRMNPVRGKSPVATAERKVRASNGVKNTKNWLLIKKRDAFARL